MSGKKGDHLRLGLFVLAGTAVLVVGMYMLGSKRNLFTRTVEVRTAFHNAGGLQPGNNVRYAGINVGTVEGVRILNDTAVEVTLMIRAKDSEYIMDNAIASLGSDGLMGNKLVNIGPGAGAGRPITDGTVLASSVPLDTDLMMRTVNRTNENLADITDNLRELAERINTPGSLVHLLSDTVLSTDLKTSLSELRGAATYARSVTQNVDKIMSDVRAGKGALGILVSDPATEQQVRDWLGTMQSLADSLASASANIDRFASGLNTPGGLAHTVTRDTAVAGDVRRTVAQLERSSITLEENLKALQRNWFFRKYFKEKAREEGKEQ
jgi:phospholipid/cholesterol/gamma-HCH transport system substrate-binding protein